MNQKIPAEPLAYYLDSSAFLHAADLPPAQCRTTPSILAEFKPGGRSHARVERYVAAGLRVEEPEAALVERVRGHAREAGSLLRLSTADLDLLAAALRAGPGAVLVTDDYTIQDVARRLDIRVQSIVTPGIQATKDWKARCAGCGRTYLADAAEHPCPVCGAQVRLKPASRASRP